MKTNRPCVVVCLAAFLAISGLLLICTPRVFLRYIVDTQLVLRPNSEAYASWEHVSSPMPMDFYLFNWTNPEEIYDANSKPKLEQLGPYRYMMELKRINVTWNENGTLTYGQQKFWYFDPEGTKGSLEDRVTTLNIPALGAAHVARSWNYLVRKGLSFTLNGMSSQIHVTHTINEMLFGGYPDSLTQMAASLPVFAGQDVPHMDKMGLFYKRNGSTEVDGIYNMGTGIDSVFGQLYAWNYNTKTPFYEGQCGQVGDASTGDRFGKTEDVIRMFLPNVCRVLVLEFVGESEVDGIVGRKYVMDKRALDNGTTYPTNQCFCNGECTPSGVLNITSCSYGSPTFLSLPHFHKASSYYTDLLEGMNPDENNHEFFIVLEPNTGIPLQANAKLQVNFMLHSIPSITLYEDVPRVFFPVMWFDQQAKIPEKDLSRLKLLLNVPTIVICVGSLLTAVGLALLVIVIVCLVKKKKKLRVARKHAEEGVPLKTDDNKIYNGFSKSLRS